ncbi:MAG TPA: response regulator transcription factor [Actinomycetota bacterium]|nr:response regulator transcription factor [Actinomycetota bacterium]
MAAMAAGATPKGRNASGVRNGDIRVVIADDHRSFGEALQIALDGERDLTVIEVVTDGEAAVEVAQERKPDVMLVDVQMPGVDGLEATRRIHRDAAETKVILLSGHDDDVVLARAVEAGARGFLRKTQAVSDLAEAIRRCYRGEPLHPIGEVERSLARFRMQRRVDGELAARVDRLTPRELEILQRVAAGEGSADIAASLGMSRHTLRTHVQNVLTKLGVHSKTDAVVAAIRFGKVKTPDGPVEPDASSG